ncbi:type II toxin-antitoxin system RelE/ParE family toxin [Ilumatobacter sp.]|uniref:type II toxin-antitoxin system RelE/ParE family toxin n=1 Tax=Ilumatobacter sp. TaxID=1967498 RepID=UPI003B52FF0D
MTLPILRPQAEVDLVERTHYYRDEGGSDLGERFFDAAITALNAIGRMPGAGSPRIGEVCGIDGLRVRRIPNFPCGWFYFASSDHVDVVRLLADAQDIAAVLADIDQG